MILTILGIPTLLASIYKDVWRTWIGRLKGSAIFKGLLHYLKSPHLPPRGILPEPTNVLPSGPLNYPLNEAFIGREDDTRWLADQLLYSKRGDCATCVAITGWRGVGKSQLIVDFCYRYGQFVHGVYWIQADGDIPAQIADCGRSMQLPNLPSNLPGQMDITLEKWREAGVHIVVFDNVESPEVIQKWMAKIFPARLLVTSYLTLWPQEIKVNSRELKIFDFERSKELLCRLAPRLKNSDENDLRNLAIQMAYLPLALELAGRYLSLNLEISLSDYLAEVKEAGGILKHPSLKSSHGSNPTYHAPLEAMLSLSWKKLEGVDNGELAKRIFRICGFCAPNEPIPRLILEEALGEEIQRSTLSGALMRLDELGLTAPTDGGRMLHSILTEFAKQKDVESKESMLPPLAEAMARIAKEALDGGQAEQMNSLREHLDAVARASSTSKLQSITELNKIQIGYSIKSPQILEMVPKMIDNNNPRAPQRMV